MPFTTEVIKWIDVDDELPDDDISVLVACGVDSLNNLDVYEAIKDSSKGGWTSPDQCMVQHVRYWAEMPSGPREEPNHRDMPVDDERPWTNSKF